MRNSPVAGAPPIDPAMSPNPQATIPFTRLLPESEPTIERPKTANINNSAEPNTRITGRAICIKKVSTIAPNNPPNNDDEKAAPNARDASPFFAKANPSSTVA